MIDYKIKQASQKDLYLHLEKCNHLFVPPLNEKVDLNTYSKKLFDNAQTFEAWNNVELVGVIAAYFNDRINKNGFITNVSVLGNYNNQGIASHLIDMTKLYAKQYDYNKLSLEVHRNNTNAVAFYNKCKFVIDNENMESIFMVFNIK